ncbi:MAG: endonuclease domain-containing protein [Anaerolineae bacterium]|nr:endonuclease domain-containing protein [Anaerolineae bacterium]
MNRRDHPTPWHAHPHLWEKVKHPVRRKRHTPTVAENTLWQKLRNRQLRGYKFRRQHVIDRFIVDFFCSEVALIVEVDGEIHQYTQEYDALRQEFLEALGFRFVRITNQDVVERIESVLELNADNLSSRD